MAGREWIVPYTRRREKPLKAFHLTAEKLFMAEGKCDVTQLDSTLYQAAVEASGSGTSVASGGGR